jgi:hypothetical protein
MMFFFSTDWYLQNQFLFVLKFQEGHEIIFRLFEGVPSNFLKGWVGHEPFFEFYKIASTPPPLHILNAAP